MDICRRLRRLATPWSRGQRRASTTTVSDGQRRVDSDGSAGGWLATESRSQSEVLGTILILGLSMTAIGIALAGGGVALGELISDAEASNVENGMSHFSSKASLVALGDADSQRFSFGSMREGTLSVQPNSGSITISRLNSTNDSRDVLDQTDIELGAVVYEGKNREIAYQGGGVWTKYDNTSRLSSPPEYHYRGTTLTVPIIQVRGEGAIGGQPQGRITPTAVAQNALPEIPIPLEEGIIEVKVQSEYYQGWYEFFSQRTDGETTIHHGNKTVVSMLTVPDYVEFNNALLVRGGDVPTEFAGKAEYDVPHRSVKPLIQTKINGAEGHGSGCIGEESCELNAGTYFYDGDLGLEHDLDIDTSSGNVTIIVDGNFDIGNQEVTVTDNSTPENGVEYYVNGSLRAQGNNFVGTDDPTVADDREVAESDRNVFYVSEGFLDDNSGGGAIIFNAIVYAPDAILDINSGSVEFTGSFAVDRVDSLNKNMELNHDASLSNTTIDITGAADPITYLHVSHNEIRVDLN